MNTREHERLFTYAEVANICRVSKSAVFRWVHEGKLRVVRLPSGQPRIPESALPGAGEAA